MRICSIPSCDRIHDSKGYCNMHYRRYEHNKVTKARGVYPHHNRFVIRFEDKYAGIFDTVEEAVKARKILMEGKS